MSSLRALPSNTKIANRMNGFELIGDVIQEFKGDVAYKEGTCHASCSDNPLCVGYTFNDTTKTCYLKGSGYELIRKNGVVSYLLKDRDNNIRPKITSCNNTTENISDASYLLSKCYLDFKCYETTKVANTIIKSYNKLQTSARTGFPQIEELPDLSNTKCCDTGKTLKDSTDIDFYIKECSEKADEELVAAVTAIKNAAAIDAVKVEDAVKVKADDTVKVKVEDAVKVKADEELVAAVTAIKNAAAIDTVKVKADEELVAAVTAIKNAAAIDAVKVEDAVKVKADEELVAAVTTIKNAAAIDTVKVKADDTVKVKADDTVKVKADDTVKVKADEELVAAVTAIKNAAAIDAVKVEDAVKVKADDTVKVKADEELVAAVTAIKNVAAIDAVKVKADDTVKVKVDEELVAAVTAIKNVAAIDAVKVEDAVKVAVVVKVKAEDAVKVKVADIVKVDEELVSIAASIKNTMTLNEDNKTTGEVIIPKTNEGNLVNPIKIVSPVSLGESGIASTAAKFVSVHEVAVNNISRNNIGTSSYYPEKIIPDISKPGKILNEDAAKVVVEAGNISYIIIGVVSGSLMLCCCILLIIFFFMETK
jgi:hypothetical protein